ncbi:UNKNOWN [Stylonychia lemnae]|uniref:Uncharacterized protein n=1 Tax=Stylonychia lemnae TaxID=5949 RepID=A0A078AQY1_STYLE|nr:UNKNOWN [Stylonychia lemnae]|eukprot:CDW83657.1 UNKNOWN [Stylonychia lemnae]
MSPGDSSSDEFDEDDQEIYSQLVVDQYKLGLKEVSHNKKVLTQNYEYRAKLDAFKRLAKQIQTENNDRNYFIIHIEHEYQSQTAVDFHMKTVKLMPNEILLKSQLVGSNTYTVDLEIGINETKIKDKVARFCKTQKISTSDEASLTNYVLVTVEAQRMAVEAKKLILEIQNFKTDDMLQEFHGQKLHLINSGQAGRSNSKKSQNEVTNDAQAPKDYEIIFEKFKKYVDSKKEMLITKIYNRMKAKALPQRIFQRHQTYEDIRMKLYSNLYSSVELVLNEGYRIIKRYRKLDFYLEKLAFDRKKEVTKNNKQKNMALKILMQKQKDLAPNFQNQRRPQSNLRGGTTLDFYNNYNRISNTLDGSPDKQSINNIKSYQNTPSPDKLQAKKSIIYQNESTLIFEDRQKGELKKMMNMQNSMELDMSTKMVVPGGITAMGYSSYMGEKKSQGDYTEKSQKDMFIQSREAQSLDFIIKSYCLQK